MKIIQRAIAVYLVIITLVAIILCVAYKAKIKETSRLRSNQTALLTDIEIYKTKDGKNAASVQALTLRCAEFKRLCADQAASIKDLGIKVKRLENVSLTVTEMRVATAAPFIRDTAITLNPIKKQMPASLNTGIIEWRDPWVSLQVKVAGKMAEVKIEAVDTLLQVVHRVPKRFLGIPFGTKAIRQEIVSSNPHTRVVYSSYIQFYK